MYSLTGGKHHSHDCKELSEALKECKGEITSILEPADQQLAAVKEALEEILVRSSYLISRQILKPRFVTLHISVMRALITGKKNSSRSSTRKS